MFKWFWTGYILVGCPWIMLKKEKVKKKQKQKQTNSIDAEEKTMKD